MNQHRYLPGELNGIESAYRRGYVATSRYDDDLALDWYGICCDEGRPFVQCATGRQYHQIDYDLAPFLDARSGLIGLTDAALSVLRNAATKAVQTSPSHMARHQLTPVSGLIRSITRDEAHALARHLGKALRDMTNYEPQEGEAA